jgi:hypothetical protein
MAVILTRAAKVDEEVLSAVYTVYDEGFEEDGAVVGFTGLLVDHSGVGECALVLLMRQDYSAGWGWTTEK